MKPTAGSEYLPPSRGINTYSITFEPEITPELFLVFVIFGSSTSKLLLNVGLATSNNSIFPVPFSIIWNLTGSFFLNFLFATFVSKLNLPTAPVKYFEVSPLGSGKILTLTTGELILTSSEEEEPGDMMKKDRSLNCSPRK